MALLTAIIWHFETFDSSSFEKYRKNNFLNTASFQDLALLILAKKKKANWYCNADVVTGTDSVCYGDTVNFLNILNDF